MSNLVEEISRRRTFAIISHPDAGKTTLTEKFLLYGGAIAQAGVVKGKKNSRAATSDWMEIEKQRGISVTSSVMQFQYAAHSAPVRPVRGRGYSEDPHRRIPAEQGRVDPKDRGLTDKEHLKGSPGGELSAKLTEGWKVGCWEISDIFDIF